MTADKRLAADLRKLRDLCLELIIKGNELMKLGVEMERLVDEVRLRVNTPMIVPGKLHSWRKIAGTCWRCGVDRTEENSGEFSCAGSAWKTPEQYKAGEITNWDDIMVPEDEVEE